MGTGEDWKILTVVYSLPQKVKTEKCFRSLRENKTTKKNFSQQRTRLWWLILFVNFRGPMHARMVGETLFLDVTVRVFLKEISIWANQLRNSDGPHPVSRGPELSNRVKEEHIWSFFELRPSIFFCPQMVGIGPSGSQVLDSDLIKPPAFLVLQLGNSSNYPGSFGTLWASVVTWAKRYCIGSIFLENPNIQALEAEDTFLFEQSLAKWSSKN